MSKAVMMSIRPQWCELIEAGKKTVEIRKNKPNLGVPFKCYIYCSKAKNRSDRLFKSEAVGNVFKYHQQDGNVIGEFVCDKITFLGNVSTDRWDLLQGAVHEAHKRLATQKACMTEEELRAYKGREAWHISELVIYNKPIPLSAWGLKRPPQSWCYVEERSLCEKKCVANINGRCAVEKCSGAIAGPAQHMSAQNADKFYKASEWAFEHCFGKEGNEK